MCKEFATLGILVVVEIGELSIWLVLFPLMMIFVLSKISVFGDIIVLENLIFCENCECTNMRNCLRNR